MSIHIFRTKMIKSNLGLMILNLFVTVMQCFFLYQNLTVDYYWQSAMNIFFIILNGYIAWNSWITVKRLRADEKNAVWGILSK